MKLQKDLREFIELLNAANVRYVVVGGYAVAFHGHPRATGDIDVFIETSEANAQKMEDVIRRFGFQATGLTREDFAQSDVIVQLGVPPNRIDIITSVDAVPFEEAWATRIDSMLAGTSIRMISKELLLRNKRALGRSQDVADAERISEDET